MKAVRAVVHQGQGGVTNEGVFVVSVGAVRVRVAFPTLGYAFFLRVVAEEHAGLAMEIAFVGLAHFWLFVGVIRAIILE